MIDRQTFETEMAVLNERFPGDRPGPVVARYYRYLNQRMDTDGFLEAAEKLFAEREHFPRPVDFVEAVEGDAEAGGMDAWERVLEMAKDWRSAKPSEVLTEAGQRALKQVGGVKKLALMDRSDLDFRRKDFLAAYATVERAPEREELPPMSERGREAIEAAGADVKSLPGADTEAA